MALEQALGLERAAGERARHVLIVTDAQVSDAGRILRLAEEEARRADRRRISVLCIDAAPNSYLAQELAERGGGVARFLTSDPEQGDIATALDEVLADWAEPVLAGLRLEVDRPGVAGRRARGDRGRRTGRERHRPGRPARRAGRCGSSAACRAARAARCRSGWPRAGATSWPVAGSSRPGRRPRAGR